MVWVWDAEKARANVIKHGVSFEAAALVFDDPLRLVSPDPHPDDDRRRVIGRVGPGTLFVVHIISDDGGGRIISARRATPSERRRYDRGYP